MRTGLLAVQPACGAETRKLSRAELQASVDRLSTPIRSGGRFSYRALDNEEATLQSSLPPLSSSETPSNSGRPRLTRRASDNSAKKSANRLEVATKLRGSSWTQGTTRSRPNYDRVSEMLMKDGVPPVKVIDAATAKAVAARLAVPRKTPQQERPAAPVKLTLQRNPNTGKLEEVVVPLPPTSTTAQVKNMVSMHERAILAEQKRQKKLADKYLQPLVATKKIDTVDDMVDHLVKLYKLSKGRSSQSLTMR